MRRFKQSRRSPQFPRDNFPELPAMPKRSTAAPGLAQTVKDAPEAEARGDSTDMPAEAPPAAPATPLEFMLSVLRDPEASLADRKWAAEKAAPYLHPRLQTVEHGGEVTLRHEDALQDLA